MSRRGCIGRVCIGEKLRCGVPPNEVFHGATEQKPRLRGICLQGGWKWVGLSGMALWNHWFGGLVRRDMKRKQADVSLWPTFDSSLLQSVASAFIHRRKTIRCQAGLSCEREYSEKDRGASERLNLDLHPGNGDLRLSVWQDGGMWLRLCVSGSGRNSGWAFMDEFHGSINDVSPETLVTMIEKTIATRFRPESSDPMEYREQLRTIWGRVQGKKGVGS
jgi:hypothetical protein